MAQRSGDEFFALVGRRSMVVFFAAVFFVFAPVGLLMSSSFVERRPLSMFLLAASISGALAVCWAASFMISRKFIAGIVLFTLGMIWYFGWFEQLTLGFRSRPSLAGVGIVVAIVCGYVLFVIFITGQGRKALRLQTEMALARQIHETLVPPLAVDGGRFEVFGVSHASSEMGGDLIDSVRHGDSTDIVLADVSGHGVRAGVVMGMVKSAIRTRLLRPGPLADLLADLNVVLEQTTSAEMYATLAALRIDGSDVVEYAVAGHHHILHYVAAKREVRRLGSRQFAVGMMPDRTYETDSTTVGTGDLLAIYTDGLNETEDADGEQLGHEPIEQLLAQRPDEPLKEIQRHIVDLARNHGAQTDDQTFLIVRIV